MSTWKSGAETMSGGETMINIRPTKELIYSVHGIQLTWLGVRGGMVSDLFNSPGQDKVIGLLQLFSKTVSKTVNGMVIHHTRGLHKRVTDRGADE